MAENRDREKSREYDLDYTQKAYETFYDIVDDPYFLREDQSVIYDALREKIKIVPFGDFLRRYIYEKAGMTGGYKEIPLSEYQQIICSEFSERQTPASFFPTTARLKNLAKNWLEQKTVNRNVVLLLGFGLGMSVNDVNDFLMKAVKEQRLNAKDPMEVICWYCYSRGYSFIRFERLWKDYLNAAQHPGGTLPANLNLESTAVFQNRMMNVTNDSELMTYLRSLPQRNESSIQSVQARQQFDALYTLAKEWAAEVLNEIEEAESGVLAERLSEKLEKDDRYYDYQKQQMLKTAKERHHRYGLEEISPANMEQVLFASIPKDRHGNLLPMKLSSLFHQFSGARLSRQHINEILDGKGQITRYDLITLSFLVCYDQRDQYDSRLKLYAAFVEKTNDALSKSGMGPLYPVNPYECFLMMCILSEDPVGTFSDVWELSYQEEPVS